MAYRKRRKTVSKRRRPAVHKRKRKKTKYSALENKAFYTGLGVGLTSVGPTMTPLTRKAWMMMNEKERMSYMNGYEKGLDNASISAGIRDPKKWF